MKISIGIRLFAAVLLSFLTVAIVAVELVRWTLIDNFSGHPANTEWNGLGGLVDRVAVEYRAHRDWSFLPEAPERRRTWLQELLAGVPVEASVPPRSPAMAYRLGLLDKDQRYLAGALASPAIVAFASIDTIQRPVQVDGKTVGYLVLAAAQNPHDELAVAFLLQQQERLLAIATIGVLLSALLAVWLAAHFRKPIRQLVAGARRLGHEQFDTRLSVRRSDELGELAESFNQLAARLAEARQARQQWVADTSHELRTPLSVLRGQLEALQDGVRSATPENIALMLRQILSLTKLVDELGTLALADMGQLHYVKIDGEIWPLVCEVVDGFSEKFRAAGLAVNVGPAPPPSIVHVDVERIRQVLTNLLENSVRYTAAGGHVDVYAETQGDAVQVVIEDSAPGVPEAWLTRLGERFFRVESSRNRHLGGAGLGLALCRQIVAAHEGRLTFAASRRGGLRVGMILKRARAT